MLRQLTVFAGLFVAGSIRADEPAMKPRVDQFGDALPAEVITRCGSGRFRHPGMIRRLEFSPDGKFIAAGGAVSVRVYDAATGKVLHRFESGDHWSIAIGFSLDSKKLTVASGRKKLTCRQYDLDTGKTIADHDLTDTPDVGELAVSGDGRLMAVEKTDKTLRIYDAATGVERGRIEKDYVRDLAFSRDGKLLTACDLTDTVRIYDTATFNVIHELRHANDQIARVSFSPDNQFLASVAWLEGGKPSEASVWDLKTGKELHRLTQLRYGNSLILFSPDNQSLLTGSKDYDIVHWNLKTGTPSRRTTAFSDATAFSPDAKLLATTSGGTIHLWDLPKGEKLPVSPVVDSYFKELRFADAGKRVVGISDHAMTWETATGKELRDFPKLANDIPRSYQLSPDETLIAGRTEQKQIRICDAKTGTLRTTLPGHSAMVIALRFSRDSKKLFSSGWDKTVKVWDLSSGKETFNLIGHDHFVMQLTDSPDGRWLASASTDAGARGAFEIRLWDLTTGEEVRQFKLLRGSVFALAFSPDGQFIAAAGGEPGRPSDWGQVQVWEVASGKEHRILNGHAGSASSIAFSRDGRVLATGAFDRTLRLWELASGKERYQFKGHEGGPDALAFGPGSRTLAMACTDAPVYIWDVTGQALNPKTTLSANELDLLWPDLAADAATAFQTMRKLVVAPDSTVSFLKNRLKAPVTIPRGKLSQLLKDLDDDKFAVRDKANRELEELGERAETALRSALENNPSLELRRRVELLLEKLKDRPSDELRTIRCLELLEWISTAEATGVVETVAKGGPDSRISRDAVRSVQRMRK